MIPFLPHALEVLVAWVGFAYIVAMLLLGSLLGVVLAIDSLRPQRKPGVMR